MSTAHSDAPQGETHAEQLVTGLRAAADWLEQHPEIAACMRGRIGMAAFDVGARETLERLAAAFGGPATEHVDISSVRVEWEVTPRVHLYGWTSLSVVGAEPVTPAYEPILGGR